ncbi:hypothetical protein AWT69_001187 [Pseudomonas putida]|nr:hypothetical protein AWT69_001187 [Pseudomonas putida]
MHCFSSWAICKLDMAGWLPGAPLFPDGTLSRGKPTPTKALPGTALIFWGRACPVRCVAA